MLRADSIVKGFLQADGSWLPVLEKVSLRAAAGSIIGILGPNGCGKTTLLNIIAGEMSADAGMILLDGVSIDGEPQIRRASTIGRVHQDSYKSLSSILAVGELLSIACRRGKRLSLRPPSPNNALSEIVSYSQYVADFLQANLHVPARYLSGGQRQLLAITAGLLGSPRVVLLDEHKASLDSAYSQEVDAMIRAFVQACAASALVVTHDHGWAKVFCDRLYTLPLNVDPFSVAD